MTDSQSLLANYVRTGADDAFRELIVRYLDLVHSAALRLVEGDAHRAEDVTQAVFADLARMARTLPGEVMLGGWLHRHTCFVAANLMRGERRRQSRERQAVEMNALQAQPEMDFTRVAPILDEAINELGEADRTAILLRFFEQQDFRAVGEALGSGEDAARMRVNRALEKLESLLKRRGVTASSAALSIVLMANAVHAAPVGLVVTVSTAAALAGTTVATTTVAAATKTIAMTTLQKTVITATIAVLAGAGIHQARQAEQLRDQVQTLQQQGTLAEQIELLQRERGEASRQLAALREENDRLNQNAAELLRLRGEVGRLRKDSRDLAWLKGGHSDEVLNHAGFWLRNLDQIKHYLDQTPNAKIPELQFLYYGEWLDAVKSGLFTTNDYRYAASQLRRQADRVVGGILRNALARYRESHSGQFPTNVSQLKPYFERSKNRLNSDAPITELDAILQRWKIVPATQIKSMIAGGAMVITQKAPVDDALDSRVVVGEGILDGGFAHEDTLDALEPIRAAYRAAHEGKRERESAELEPFVSTPEQKSALQRLMLSEKWWE